MKKDNQLNKEQLAQRKEERRQHSAKVAKERAIEMEKGFKVMAEAHERDKLESMKREIKQKREAFTKQMHKTLNDAHKEMKNNDK